MLEWFAVDGECYFDRSSYSLQRKDTTTDGYVSDPRFQLHCLALCNEKTHVVLPREAIQGWLNKLNPSKVGFIVQHGHFDGAYLWQYYVFRPAMWIDTLLMSRAVSGLSVKHSLAALCERYGLPPKDVAYDSFEGRRWEELSPESRQRQARDCLGDAERTWRLAELMLPEVPPEELRIMDLTIRKFTEPVVVGNQQILSELIKNEADYRQDLLNEYGLTEEHLASDDKFEQVLLDFGIDVQYKPAKNKRGFKGCFAVSDEFMKELLNHEDPGIAGITEIRISVKSTIQRTRAQTLLEMAQRGPLRVYYGYYSARNARFAGAEATNFQNLPSRGRNGVGLRRAINSPSGTKFVIGDSAQIECRMLQAFSGQFDTLAAFRRKEDLYCQLATKIFGREITKKDELERQCGKTGELQLGYGSGYKKYRSAIKRMTGIDLGDQESLRHVQVYRDTHEAITGRQAGKYRREGGLWGLGEEWLAILASGGQDEYWAPEEPGQPSYDKPLLRIEKQKIILPNGLKLHYDGLHWGELMGFDGKEKKGWKLPTLDGHITMYGSKLIQNINSALARLILTQAELRVIDRIPWAKAALDTHDDMAFVVPEARQHEALGVLQEEMSRSPKWLPNLPVSADCQIRTDYAK